MNAKTSTADKALRIPIDGASSVSALLQVPDAAVACYVFAHGAGAGMDHPWMQRIADGLCDRQIATLRYQFPYLERGSRRPDTPAVAHSAVRAACVAAHNETALALVAGGKSFGGRMTSQAQALAPLPHVVGLAFLGFPLHPPDEPSDARAKHLADVRIPMLFVQGPRDKLAALPRMARVVHDLGSSSTLLTIDSADHGFDVLVRSGRKPEEVFAEVLDGLAGWVRTTLDTAR